MTLSILFLGTLVSSSYGVRIPGPLEAVYQTQSGQYAVEEPAIQAYGTDSAVSSTSITVDQVVQNVPSSYSAPASAYLEQQTAPVDVIPAYGAPPPPSVPVAPIADITPPQTPSYQAPAPSAVDYIPTPATSQQQPAIIPPAPGQTPPPCTEDAPGPYQTAAPEIREYTPPTETSVQETITFQTQVVDQGPIPGGLYGSSSTETQAPSIYANGADAAAAKISAMAGFALMVLVL